MSYSDLLDRMKSNDAEAFLELTDRYGWSVYTAIREKYTDPKMADKIYNETMNGFYHSLSDSSADDPLEALLFAFVDRISPEKLVFDSFSMGKVDMVPNIQLIHNELPARNSCKAVRKKKGFWYGFGVVMVLTAIVAALWCIAGLLMEMNYLPYYDLGFSWFIANVMQLF